MSSSESPGDNARMEVVQCERDMHAIKAALRKVSTPDASGEETQNTLEVVWVGMDENGDAVSSSSSSSLELSLQLSSPVEEATLNKVRGDSGDNEEGSSTVFSGVETSMATLTISLRKDGQVVGVSESYDLAPICSLEDAMNPKDEYVTELPVAIISKEKQEEEATKDSVPEPDKGDTEDAEKTESKEDSSADDTKDTEGKEEEKEESKAEEEKHTEAETKSEEKEEASASVIKPLCTLKLRIIFKPSAKDQKEELYELLNKTSQKKSQALERLRGQQTAMTKGGASGSTSVAKKSPAVKAGFLNKKAKKPVESKWKQFYDKHLGPQSLARGIVFPIAKNYVIFFGAVILCHFKGQELALPAPV